jgi:hypothetical protein
LQDSSSTVQYTGFFADCEHELTPLTSGMRLVLAYNLVYTGPAAAAPRLTGRTAAEEQLQHALKGWQAELAAGGQQTRIAFLLGGLRSYEVVHMRCFRGGLLGVKMNTLKLAVWLQTYNVRIVGTAFALASCKPQAYVIEHRHML